MNSKKECKNKKHFLRNFKQPIPKHVQVEQKISENESTTDCEESFDIKLSETEPVNVITDVPKRNFLKCIEKRIDKIQNLEVRKLKSKSELSKEERLTYNEKVTKQMNFPFDKKLYKELISLQLNDKPVLQPISINYEPTIRDKVPKLEDFYIPTQKPEYNIPIITNLGSHAISRSYDGLRLHKLMCLWKNENFN